MKTTISRLAGIVCLTIILAGCSESQPPDKNKPLAVATISAEQPHRQAHQFTGTLQPRYKTELGFRVAGAIAERLVEPGEKVNADQNLAVLDDADFIERKEAADATLKASRENHRKAEKDLTRGKELLREGAIGQEQLEAYQVAYQSAEQQLQQALSEQRQASNALSYTRLVAPQAGIIVDITAEPGLVVGQGQPVVQLAQGNAMQVVVDLPAAINAPEKAHLILNDQQVSLSRFSQAGALDPQTFTRRVRYQLDETAKGAVFGQLGTVEISNNSNGDNLFSIPISALDERGEQARVWVIRDGSAVTQPVQVVKINTYQAIISSSALDLESQIISQGINRLNQGQKVRAVN